MIENGSWSMTFEEVSYLSVYVCDTGVCLSAKCSILLPKVTNQTLPAALQLLCWGGGGQGTNEASCHLLFAGMVSVVGGWGMGRTGQCAFPGLWKPGLLPSLQRGVGSRLPVMLTGSEQLGTSASVHTVARSCLCMDRLTGDPQAHSGRQPLLTFQNERSPSTWNLLLRSSIKLFLASVSSREGRGSSVGSLGEAGKDHPGRHLT